MNRKEIIGNATLYLGDCLDVACIERSASDLLLTDPPFGVREDGWDLMEERDLWRFTARWATTIESRRAAVFHPDKHASVFRSIFGQIYERVRTLTWDKPLGSQYAGAAQDGMWYASEPILYCTSGSEGASNTIAAMARGSWTWE